MELSTEGKIVHDGSGFAIADGKIKSGTTAIADARLTYRIIPYPSPEFQNTHGDMGQATGLPIGRFPQGRQANHDAGRHSYAFKDQRVSVSDRHDVWITGVGLVSALGEGLDQHWDKLMAGGTPAYDDKTFAPYITFPTGPLDLDTQIPKRDQRQMEAWQRIGVYAAGLALTDAGIAKNVEILDRTDMIVAAGGGERDVTVDTAILTDARDAEKRDAFVNERLMNDLRPTLFLAQLPNLLAGNISLVHGVVGSSRTFMGEEASGADALNIAHARIAAGQSDISLVGGAYNGTRWDLVLLFRARRTAAGSAFPPGLGSRPKWRTGPRRDGRLRRAGKPRACGKARRQADRQARRVFYPTATRASRAIPIATLQAEWASIEKSVNRDSAVVISGASGARTGDLAKSARFCHVSASRSGPPPPISATGWRRSFSPISRSAASAVRKGTLFPASGSGDTDDAPADGISQAAS